MKDWTNYIDEWGLVTQSNKDGGDSCNRTFTVLYLTRIKNEILPFTYPPVFSHLEHPEKPGLFRRHPDENKWYGAWDRLSRDQAIPLVIYTGVFNNKKRLKSFFLRHLLTRGLLFMYNTKRNFQYPTLEEHLEKSTPDVKWNYKNKLPDFTGPEFWGMYIRGFECRWLYWLLPILDLETLIGAIITRFKKNKTDVINHYLVSVQQRQVCPTPISWLARQVLPDSEIKRRLDIFFGRAEEPPINELV